MIKAWNEDQLMDLLAFIAGKGRFNMLGNGIHTYPDGDQRDKTIYSGCLELEKRNLIYRKIDQADYVLFMAY